MKEKCSAADGAALAYLMLHRIPTVALHYIPGDGSINPVDFVLKHLLVAIFAYLGLQVDETEVTTVLQCSRIIADIWAVMRAIRVTKKVLVCMISGQ